MDSEDPNGIEGVMEKFMVCLARAVKDDQKEKKCCYHCSSLDHFINDCPLGKNIENGFTFKPQGWMAPKKGAWNPQMKVTTSMMPPEGAPKV